MALQAKIRLTADIVETGAPASGAVTLVDSIDWFAEFLTGTGAFQADLVYSADLSIATAGTLDLDLSGVLAKAVGGTITAAELVGMIIVNSPESGVANTTNLTIGVGTNPVVGWLGGTTPTVGPIRPGGLLVRMETDAAGMCVITAATGDILRIANSAGATNNFRIILLMRSA